MLIMKRSQGNNMPSGSQELNTMQVPTGLFIHRKLSSILIKTVYDDFCIRFGIKVLTRPSFSNETDVEIVLVPQFPGAKVAEAKHLIAGFLKKKSLKKMAGKDISDKVEVIELDSDDDACDNSKQLGEMVILDNSAEDSMVGSQLIDKECNGNVKDNAKKKGLKRKSDSNDIDDEVQILDDDIIILEESFSSNSGTNNKNSKSSNISIIDLCDTPKTSTTTKKPAYLKEIEEILSKDTFTDRQDSAFTRTSTKSASSSVSHTVTSNEARLETYKEPTRASKLAYKRIAHLICPLTKPSDSSIATNFQSNIYNPNAGLKKMKKSGLRPIIIDGNNVAIGHGKGLFSVKGLKICINYFEKRGHRDIKAFVPHYRKNPTTYEELNALERHGTVVITPSRKVKNKLLAPYDDRYIVQYAVECEGVIISSDNFRDLLDEDPSWKETIEKRLLAFTWIDDLLMFPKDPLGRNGPTLDEFLSFPDS